MINSSTEIKDISIIADIMANDGGWLQRQPNSAGIIEAANIDGEIQGLNVVIYLVRNNDHVLADQLLTRLRGCYPNGGLTFYHSATLAAHFVDYEKSAYFASRALSLSPTNFEFRSLLTRVYAIWGDKEKARCVLRNALPRHRGERFEYEKLAQFVDLCDEYPPAKLRTTLDSLKSNGAYSEPGGCREMILERIRDGGPFSMVRIGDGEAAWHRFDAYDEGRFACLYRSNRSEFLQDWFGSTSLIDNDKYIEFSQSLQNTFSVHDLIGINPSERLKHEESLLSLRGISTAINTFRFLDLFDGSSHGRHLCSNSINLALMTETDFYQQLFRMRGRFGIITSQPSLAATLRQSLFDVPYDYVVPGDSRNFHLGADGLPECQYPEYVEKIDNDLSSKDLRGIVFLVAAGYVGKRYLATIRARGGVAIDVGSLADYWARNGLPI